MAVDPSTSTGDGDGDGSPSAAAAREIEYRFYCEFQSHDPEFDYLKSLEIEERINKIRWCRARTGPLFLLSTNDKTIKLWKVHEKSGRVVTSRNVDPSQPPAAQRAPFLSGPSAVVMPTLQPMQPMVTATLKRTYGNGHAYHINSLSFNADGETYLSADDLRIHIWNLNTAQQAYNIADLKPADMEELSEVIMAAEFHPTDCAALAYCSSKGVLRLADLRERALCDAKGGCRTFRPQADAEASSFFSEVVSSMTDVKFSRDGRRLMTRDYMTVKVWDVAMEREPLRTIKVLHPHSRAQSSVWCPHLSSPRSSSRYRCTSTCARSSPTCTRTTTSSTSSRRRGAPTCAAAARRPPLPLPSSPPLSPSPQGRSVCSGSYDSKLHIWDVSGPDGVDAGTPDPITLEATTASPRRSAFKGWGGAARKDSLSVNFNKKVRTRDRPPSRRRLLRPPHPPFPRPLASGVAPLVPPAARRGGDRRAELAVHLLVDARPPAADRHGVSRRRERRRRPPHRALRAGRRVLPAARETPSARGPPPPLSRSRPHFPCILHPGDSSCHQRARSTTPVPGRPSTRRCLITASEALPTSSHLSSRYGSCEIYNHLSFCQALLADTDNHARSLLIAPRSQITR